MRIVRALVFVAFLISMGSVVVLGQQAGVAAPGAQGQTAQAQQAYHLPPEKLAKAIALNRIRDIEHFVDAFWGLLVLWLLLSTRAAAGMEAWAKRASNKRWIQGLVFFAMLIVVLTLTELPLDMYMHNVSREYGISVQGWGSWFGDQGKALGLAVVFGSLVMLLFQWIVKKWPRRYWFGIWVATLPLMVLAVFVSPLIEPLFNKYEPLSKNYPGLVASSSRWRRGRERIFRRSGCF